MTTESISVVSSNSAGRVNLAPRPLPSTTSDKLTMSSDNVTPQQGSTTRYGDHHKQQQHHQESLVIKGKIGTAWHYRFCTTHEDNYDDNETNHINNLRTIYNTINNNTNDIYILHQQTKNILTNNRYDPERNKRHGHMYHRHNKYLHVKNNIQRLRSLHNNAQHETFQPPREHPGEITN